MPVLLKDIYVIHGARKEITHVASEITLYYRNEESYKVEETRIPIYVFFLQLIQETSDKKFQTKKQ